MDLRTVGHFLGRVSPRLQPRSLTRETLLGEFATQFKTVLPGAIEALDPGREPQPIRVNIEDGRLLQHLIGAKRGRDPRSRPVPARRLQAEAQILGTALAARLNKADASGSLLDIDLPLQGLRDEGPTRWVWDGHLVRRDRADITQKATESLRVSIAASLQSALTEFSSRRIHGVMVSGGITYGHREVSVDADWGRLAFVYPELVHEAVQPLLDRKRGVLATVANRNGDTDKIGSSTLTFAKPVGLRNDQKGGLQTTLPFFWEPSKDSPLIDILEDRFK